MKTVIKGGRVIDPGKLDDILDIVIKGGNIVEIKQDAFAGNENKESKVIDASGKIVAPGLIDMHVHLRDPGHEYKETIETGGRAAAYGGFTAICCMPNTNPVNDCRQVTEYIIKKAVKAGTVRVYPVAAISRGLKGDSLCEYGELKETGAIAVSDDGNPVMSSQLMRKALEYSSGFNLPVISHCEDLDLVSGGAMNEGAVATKMGISGIPNAAESIMVLRDIALCELTGIPVHIAHVSTKESVRAIRDAKKRGVPVTAETAPHYFLLTDVSIKGYNTNYKMNPPLRTEEDRVAICQGLADGTIDAIATDHAPHSIIEKAVEFDQAANGIIGLETAVSLGLKLVEAGIIDITNLIEKMSRNPARILGLKTGLEIGKTADITIIDPEISFCIDADRFQSLSRNTPFDGWDVKGKAVLTMVGGKTVFRDEHFV
ncbi:MAG TPA: dihydroorotase [Desulfobacterales bacterium]|nr:dihydroorotase [Desulfobacterales bacterium]